MNYSKKNTVTEKIIHVYKLKRKLGVWNNIRSKRK